MTAWLSASENAALAVADDEYVRVRQTHHWHASRRLWRAVMLAPTVEVLDALLAGERVPLGALDPLWVQRFGLRG